MDVSDEAAEPDPVLNHLDQNHYPTYGGSDSEAELDSLPAGHQENHARPEELGRGGEEEEEEEEEEQQHEEDEQQEEEEPHEEEEEEQEKEERPAASVSGSEDEAELLMLDELPARYLSPAALKKHLHEETSKVNNELRALITKEIRKPGRCTCVCVCVCVCVCACRCVN